MGVWSGSTWEWKGQKSPRTHASSSFRSTRAYHSLAANTKRNDSKSLRYHPWWIRCDLAACTAGLRRVSTSCACEDVLVQSLQHFFQGWQICFSQPQPPDFEQSQCPPSGPPPSVSLSLRRGALGPRRRGATPVGCPNHRGPLESLSTSGEGCERAWTKRSANARRKSARAKHRPRWWTREKNDAAQVSHLREDRMDRRIAGQADGRKRVGVRIWKCSTGESNGCDE